MSEHRDDAPGRAAGSGEDAGREGLFAGGPGRGKAVEVRTYPRGPGMVIAWTAAAALAVATVLSWLGANRMRAERDGTQRQLAELRQQLDSERRWSAVMNAPGARFAELVSTPAGAAAMRARATFDPATRSAVLVFENAAPPAGRDYELWAMRAGGVASLGVIRPDAGGHAVLRLENAGDPAALTGFAVSLENEGGSGDPTAPAGSVVMAGRFGVE